LAHELDKSINTLPGSPEFARTAESEIGKLERCLEAWKRRLFDADETIMWANEMISEARSLMSDYNYQKKVPLDLNIDYKKAEELFYLVIHNIQVINDVHFDRICQSCLLYWSQISKKEASYDEFYHYRRFSKKSDGV